MNDEAFSTKIKVVREIVAGLSAAVSESTLPVETARLQIRAHLAATSVLSLIAEELHTISTHLEKKKD